MDLKEIKNTLMDIHESIGEKSLGLAVGTIDGEVVVGTETAGKEFDAEIAVQGFSKALKDGKNIFNELDAGDLMYVMMASSEKIGLVMPVGERYLLGLAARWGLNLRRAMFEMKIAQNHLAEPLYG
ncbi:MAG: hypothetical protein CW694_05300 [Candidatus Syntrophoarchaeum sp. WYZ-LMO15]|nr:MAG: hypothetical protein CW694_05300 [Candidatus Syntrophoarchaeum sp. WYZ-LMO15]